MTMPSVGIRGVQCIGLDGHHPFWHDGRVGSPRQQPGQSSGDILKKRHVRCLGEIEQQLRLAPGASG
ncbi:hypothetical protein TNCV_1029771 [Trichonephila clavipes]|nr:hypothetical protein TNCV_1029771 [Trichonephila clavipes]